ncbi:MAG: hypothetical protein LBC59_03360 [Chitinispirillales bacterium]|jgi:uncharacterized protein (TIGR02145 family)|nr:hypothetical protein [Chitinispirillales bacterium]
MKKTITYAVGVAAIAAIAIAMIAVVGCNNNLEPNSFEHLDRFIGSFGDNGNTDFVNPPGTDPGTDPGTNQGTKYNVTIVGGRVGSFGSGRYSADDIVTIYAGKASGDSVFSKWTPNISSVIEDEIFNSVEDTAMFTMPKFNVIMTANWRREIGTPSPEYILTVKVNGSGCVFSSCVNNETVIYEQYASGTFIYLNGKDGPQSSFLYWTFSYDDGSVYDTRYVNNGVDNFEFQMPSHNVTVTAVFEDTDIPPDPPQADTMSFSDDRDGHRYKAVRIGDQVWMAENLNYQPLDGSGNSWCYDNEDSYCNQYGRLYDWETALTVCPTNWHLPTREEWGALAEAAGGTGDYGTGGTAGKALKSTSGWNNNGNGTDVFGFSALPGGYRDSDGNFKNGGGLGYWWTATQESWHSYSYYRNIYYESDYVYEYHYYLGVGDGLSVRCVAD